MIHKVPALALVTALLLWAAPSTASDGDYVDPTVTAWSSGDPVHVNPDSGALSADAADALRDRITGWRDDVFVAVLPAAAVRQGAGDDAEEASALLDALYAAMGERDGVYLVNLSGAGTYAAGYGAAPGAEDVGRIVAEEVDEHTLGQVDQVLDGTLDELGAPDDDGLPVLPLVAALLVVAALAVAGGLLWRRRGPRRRPSGETWAGPADYRPGFPTYGDQSATVEQRAALAREDVTRLGEELDAADPPLSDPAVAAHVQAALDAYADASRRVDGLSAGAVDDEELRAVGQTTEYARWQLATAQALLTRTPPPARRLPCFVDPAHGTSVADASWAPPGGTLRPVPVCRACYDRLTDGARR